MGHSPWEQQGVVSGRCVPHPLAVVRLGGLPIAASQFSTGVTSDLRREIERLSSRYDDIKQTLCDVVGELVPAAFDRSNEDGRALLRLRRDLFNARPMQSKGIEVLRALAPEEHFRAIVEMMEWAERLRVCEAGFEAAHAAEVEAGQTKALSLADDVSFRRAIDITNRGLSRALSSYAQTRGFRSPKDRAQVAGAVARYAFRAGQKTSPLSSFGLVGVGRIEEDRVEPNWRSVDASMDRVFQIRAGALDYVVSQLLQDLQHIAPTGRLCLNSTVREEGEELHWGATQRDDPPTWRVRRARLLWKRSSSTFLRLLSRILTSRDGATMTLGELRATLGTILPKLSTDQLDALLSDAWTSGFIQPRVRWNDMPLTLTASAIALLRDEIRDRVEPAFDRLCAALAVAEQSSLPTDDVETAFAELVAAAGLEVSMGDFQPIIFEDCGLSLGAVAPPVDAATTSDLQRLLHLAPMLSAHSPMGRMRRLLTKRFVEDYGEGGSCGDALEFVRNAAIAIDDLLAGSPQEQGAKLAKLRVVDADQEMLMDLRDQFVEDLVVRARQGANVTLSDGDLATYVARAGSRRHGPCRSQMFFMQPYTDEGAVRWALNHMYPGAGSTFSRFVPDRQDYMDAARSYLADIAEDGGYLELEGHFAFNACFHPRFASRVVAVPPDYHPDDGTLSLSALRIRHRPETADLVFVDDQGRDVSIFFLAILSPFTMARMQQVVRVMGAGVEMVDDLWRDMAPRLEARSDGVIVVPRINLGRVTIARRTLICPRGLMPSAGSAPDVFYTAFNRWCDVEELPRYLFVQRAKVEPSDGVTPARLQLADGKVSKPMPLDRDCPLSVQLFQKDLAMSKFDLAFIEALPSPDDVQCTRNGEAVVTELGVELSFVATPDTDVAGIADSFAHA